MVSWDSTSCYDGNDRRVQPSLSPMGGELYMCTQLLHSFLWASTDAWVYTAASFEAHLLTCRAFIESPR